jgi:DinB superfamily
MKLKSLLLACFVILSAVSIFAQSGGTAVDPISGVWTGDLGPNADTRFPLRLELKFDGKAAISGAITGLPLPGEIKVGTFDPKTGALKLEVEVKGDGAIRQVVLEGTVVSGAATGRVSSANQTGNFKITKVDGDSGASRQSGANDTAAALRYGFGEVSGWVTKAADLVPADKYDYRPSPSVRTFGQLIAHIADSHNYYCARAVRGRNVQWSDAVEKGSLDKATLGQKLKQSIDACNAVYAGSGEVGSLFGNIGHTNLHYGNIITYMRMLGLKPPSS